jgi:hypothetical protein
MNGRMVGGIPKLRSSKILALVTTPLVMNPDRCYTMTRYRATDLFTDLIGATNEEVQGD